MGTRASFSPRVRLLSGLRGGPALPHTHHPEAVPQAGAWVLEAGQAGGTLSGAGLLSLLHCPAVAPHLAGQTQDSGLPPGPLFFQELSLRRRRPAPWPEFSAVAERAGREVPLRSTASPSRTLPSPGHTRTTPVSILHPKHRAQGCTGQRLTCQASVNSSRLLATMPSGSISSLPASLSLVPRRPADTPVGQGRQATQ